MMNSTEIRAWTDRLYTEYEDILFQFRIRLLKPVIRIEPLSRNWGQWNPETRTITLSVRLFREYPWDIVVEVLKHEMAHQLADDRMRIGGNGHTAHDSTFQHACRMLGVAEWAASATGHLPLEIPNWRNRALTPDEEKLMKRAGKLLALAESSNEHEAALAVERVRELYAKYNLERLSAGTRPAHVHCVINMRRRRIESDDSAIFSILNGHFMVRTVFISVYDAGDLCDYRAVELLGDRENVLMAEYVYHFLRNKLDSLWKDYRARTGRTGRFKRSYMLGVLAGFREKLEAASVKADSGREDGASKALLRVADAQLEAFVARRHPRLVTRWWGSGYRDRESFGAGRVDGAAITLHRGIAHRAGNRGLSLPGD